MPFSIEHNKQKKSLQLLNERVWNKNTFNPGFFFFHFFQTNSKTLLLLFIINFFFFLWMMIMIRFLFFFLIRFSHSIIKKINTSFSFECFNVNLLFVCLVCVWEGGVKNCLQHWIFTETTLSFFKQHSREKSL